MTQLLPPKKEVALALLERSNVDVYLDPRAKGVVVPPQFRKEPRLILKIGLNMPVPIPDLRLDDESMSCTLSFNRSPFYCVVPWPSVFAMVGEDGRGMVWPDDVPQELAVKVVDPGSDARVPPDRESSAGAMRSRTAKKGQGAVASADDAKDSSRGNGKRGGKKKKDERPVLVAVSSDRSPESTKEGKPSSSKPGRNAKAEPAPASSPAPESAAAGSASAPPAAREGSRPATPSGAVPQRPAGAPRPKRELPPYLRVVK
ncbi:MAG: hypothetical protein JST00_30300 [Deltaproteobacteria bacterium]|nr:hypothetical protein [Deltaproteobacteria bacterium]